MSALKDAVVGLAVGVGLFVTVVVGRDAIERKPAVAISEKGACYEVVSIRPELGIAITFNVCTGQFGLSQFPADIRRAPKGSASGAFVKPKGQEV